MESELKTLLVYMPLTWQTLSSRVFKSFLDLIGPESQAKLAEMGYQIKTLISDTFPLCRNRNEAVELAMKNDCNADLIFFADADQIWPKDTLPTLVSHISEEHPVVSGLYWKKAFPHACVQGFYSPWTNDLKMRKDTIEKMGFVDKDGNQCAFYRPLLDFTTVQEIDVAGCGVLLAKTDVFKRIDLPYFGYFNPYILEGDYSIQHMSEEMLFFCKLRKANIKTLVIPSVKCGHEVARVIGCPEQ